MANAQMLEIQQGIWIDGQWLKSAGLGSRIRVLVDQGEIRIVAAPAEIETKDSAEKGWSVFRSLGDKAPRGKLQDASLNHDRYLYNGEE